MQPAVASALARQIRSGERAIAGVMLESNLLGGAQSLANRPLLYGQSITDGCLSWEATLPVLDGLALAVRVRRQLRDVPCPDLGQAVGGPEKADAGLAGKPAHSQASKTANDSRLRVLIADDEPLARARLLALLPRNIEIIGECATGIDAQNAMRRDRPDIAFLDMQMPGCDGLQAVAGLEPSERPAIVFVTAHQKFAVEAFDIRAVDYVLKPFDRQRLTTALERAAEYVQARRAGGLAPCVVASADEKTETGLFENKGTINPCGPNLGRGAAD
jgi:CheY-like chemotaxis protein